MHKSFVLLGIVAGFASAAASAQMPGLSGSAPDIRNSDLSTHDTVSTPDLHDQLLKYRERERSDKIRAQSNSLGPSRLARKDELTVGAIINDKSGIAIAKVEQVDVDGVVVSMGTAKVKVPAEAFGHNKAGLLLDMTKAQFEQVVASANSAH